MTMAFKMVLGPEMERALPGMRNSNLLPVKAKGEVRLRSVLSRGILGSTCTPTFSSPRPPPS